METSTTREDTVVVEVYFKNLLHQLLNYDDKTINPK
jgi:hypothetical protein